jgi:hypothetical protein
MHWSYQVSSYLVYHLPFEILSTSIQVFSITRSEPDFHRLRLISYHTPSAYANGITHNFHHSHISLPLAAVVDASRNRVLLHDPEVKVLAHFMLDTSIRP